MNPALEKALIDESDDFLHFLRAMMWLHNAGVDERPAAIQEVKRLDAACGGRAKAKQLALIEGDRLETLRLTSVGKQVCDGVKQYCNWLGRADELPPGVTEDMVRGKEVLDVGCGVGCALLTFARHGATRLVGLDLMESFPPMARILAARQRMAPPFVVLSDGAALPFTDGSFDLIFCRLAFNYMRCDAALSEMARVARSGAHLVICLNTLRWHVHATWKDLKRLNWRAIAFDAFCLANGLLFHTLHRQMTLRYHGKMHSVHSSVWHTPWTMKREMARAGFEPWWNNAPEHPGTPTFCARRRKR